MIKNVVDLGNAALVTGTLSEVVAAFDAERDLPALRALVEGEGNEPGLEQGLMLILRSGSLTLQSGGAEITLQPGEVATVPVGCLAWKARAAELVIAGLKTGAAGVAFAKIDTGHALSPGGQPNPILVTSAMPETMRHAFADAGELSWGLWSATPYERSTMTYRFSELMYLQQGAVTIGNAAEGYQSFSAGDVFIIHRGADASWSNAETVLKLWLIHSPA